MNQIFSLLSAVCAADRQGTDFAAWFITSTKRLQEEAWSEDFPGTIRDQFPCERVQSDFKYLTQVALSNQFRRMMEDEKSSQSIWIINRRLRDDKVDSFYRETQKLLKDYQSNLESNAENTARPPKEHLIIVCLPFQWTVCRFQLWAIGRRSGDKNMDVWRLIGQRRLVRNDSTKRVQRVKNNFSSMFCPTEWINYKHRETRWSVCCLHFTSHRIMGRIDHRSRLQMALISNLQTVDSMSSDLGREFKLISFLSSCLLIIPICAFESRLACMLFQVHWNESKFLDDLFSLCRNFFINLSFVLCLACKLKTPSSSTRLILKGSHS